MKRNFNLINLFLIISVLIGDIFFILNGNFWVKTATSLGFVLIGIFSLIYALKNKTLDKKFCIVMLVGLFFAMLGDVVIELDFIIGAVLFAVGHVFYFVAYCFLISFKWTDLLAGAIIFVPSTLFILLAPIFKFESSLMQIVCVVYAIIISCMVGKSITNFIRTKNVLCLVVMIGSILFFISDLMLLLRNFAHLGAIVRILCLATYYPAECFLAYSLMLTKKKDIENNKI